MIQVEIIYVLIKGKTQKYYFSTDIDEYKLEKDVIQVLQHEILQFVTNYFNKFLTMLYEK